ncbi:hypothetical protein EGM88_11185 [Aureibaculum marinum]|uniref:Uncharacterized protein n=1 Tax=Aureibaculum marinum TaxID=2487930 RepID=A0A3N4NHY0_9FLAO|nr:hypothetical protein [Aureibaculum marinum]RPD96022.1 hypothetical protein EGM88_11185 [Aureibaculum marinum]
MNNFTLLNLKLHPSFLAYFTLIFIFISCEEKKISHENKEPTKEMLAHIIETEKAVNMYQNYKKERIDILKDTLSTLYGKEFNDTRLVQVNLKILKNYIAYVEKRSKENNINPESLHFYFSVYPSNKEGIQKHHQTFFIAPATKDGNNQYGYTLQKKGNKSEILYLKDVLSNHKTSNNTTQDIQKASFFSLSQDEENGLIFNDQNSVPPYGGS